MQAQTGSANPSIDLNDLRVFERVASLRSFSAASNALHLPKSTVSRRVVRLETVLAARLLQRTTRGVALTEAGTMLLARCSDLMGHIKQTIEDIGSLTEGPRGTVRTSAGFGFGLNVLAEIIPRFMKRYPHVAISLNLSGRTPDLVADGIDVAIQIGPLSETSLIARRLGEIRRYLCAAPAYLRSHGTPITPSDLNTHGLINICKSEGRQLEWTLQDEAGEMQHRQYAKLSVNCALTAHQMLINGGGIGISFAHLCVPEFQSGRLARVLPDYTLPPLPVHIIFPSRRQLSPGVRAFVDFIVEESAVASWLRDVDKF